MVKRSRNCKKSSSHNHERQFFKVYLPGLSSQQLVIPPAFVRHLNGDIPHDIILKDCTGRQWHCRVEEIEGGLAITNGWNSFAIQHSLVTGDFLVFNYSRDSLFTVNIFGTNGCIKEGTFFPNLNINHDKDETEIEEERTLNTPDHARPQKYSENVLRRSKRSGRVDKRKNLKTATYAIPKNPYFVTIIGSKYYVHVSGLVVKAHGIGLNPDMTLRDKKGKKWPVKVALRKNSRIGITQGWINFYYENNLKRIQSGWIQMDIGAKEILTYICYCIFFPPVFACLFVIGMVKGAIFAPYVFQVIAFGDAAVVVGLFPLHVFWSIYSLTRTKKFGPYMKCLLILLVPVQTALYIVVAVLGSAVMGVGYGYVWPVMQTFKAISKEGVPFYRRVLNCITVGTFSCVWGACTIVRDFADFSFHSYFSVVDELLESKGEEPIELNVLILPGCLLSVALGLLVDGILIPAITLYKTPILLFKGWYRLIQDLIGREGPFLETVCVPFAGLWILLWPVVVIIGALAGAISFIGFGGYAAVVAYEENSTKRGLLYVIASASLFDEYTNDLLYLREGSCFPRPKYCERMDSTSSMLPIKGLREQFGGIYPSEPLIRNPSDKAETLKAAVILESFFVACKDVGKELLKEGAIQISDLEEWRRSKNKIVNIGIPAYSFLECFLHSIMSGSGGFILRDNVEITSANRPEGKIFDWLYEPMCIMKEQIKSLNLSEAEERYFRKLCLYNGNVERIESWQNGGIPPEDPIKRAQLEGITRRLHGFCLTLSRLPTSRRRFYEVVKAIELEGNRNFSEFGSGHEIEVA